jgi:hypothetical protein
MGVSLTGSRMPMSSIRSTITALAVVAALAIYAYGPAVSPAMQASAAAECNDLTGGSYRGYRLQWTLTARPHWTCWDQRDAARPAMNLGWWVTPVR